MHLLLAHQGGWDDLAYLAVPAVGVLVWVRWAEKRARRRSEATGKMTGTSIADDSDQP